MNIQKTLCFTAALALSNAALSAEITIATVNNGHMITMQSLTGHFEKDNPGIKVNWVTLDEGTLRQRVTTDIATKGGQFDVMTIGMYEAPMWGAKGWLHSLEFGSSYDVDDLLPAMRNGLSANGNLYAAPFYGESSMIMYRKDLLDAAGMSMPDNPTWGHVQDAAAAMTDKANGVYGICLRGKPGWGDNMAFLTTMANSFGARWFDEEWKPQLDSPAWNHAVNFYVNLMQNYGPPGASSNGHNENRALFANAKCATWVDATSAAGYQRNKDTSKVSSVTDFFQAPKQATSKGTGWFWSWAMAIPSSSQEVDVAKDFLKWATSKEYFQKVGATKGWVAVPSGARKSIEEDPRRLAAAPFAKGIVDAILSVDPTDPSLLPVPYTGVQYVAIPEFQGIGNYVGQQVAAALAGQQSVDEALENSQQFAEREMKKAGYN